MKSKRANEFEWLFFVKRHRTEYRYDESGLRTYKNGPLGTNLFADQYFEKRGSDTYKYIFAGNRRIASLSSASSGLNYFHPDALGSLNYVTDASGNIVLHRENAPFGEVAEESTSNDVKIGFSDESVDDESNLVYFGSRYLLPGVGRWLSADPLYANATSNQLLSKSHVGLFQFSFNNPLRFKDNDGNEPFDIWEYKSDGRTEGVLKYFSVSNGIQWVEQQMYGTNSSMYTHSSVELPGQLQFTATSKNDIPFTQQVIPNSNLLFRSNNEKGRSIDVYRLVTPVNANVTLAQSFADQSLNHHFQLCSQCVSNLLKASGVPLKNVPLNTPFTLSHDPNFSMVGTYNTAAQRSELPPSAGLGGETGPLGGIPGLGSDNFGPDDVTPIDGIPSNLQLGPTMSIDPNGQIGPGPVYTPQDLGTEDY